MDNTRAQQKALDDELVTPANRLKIGKSNLQLSSNLKSKEPTLQVVLDALKLTIFYKAFEITADVPEIYMQEFWVTVSRHHSSLRFKLNDKSHTVNVDNFRDMLKICPKLPDLVYQVENKNSKKNNDMDEFMFTTIRVISKHQDTLVYGAILPQHLTNQAMLESEAYKTYLAYATGEKIPKPKYVKNKDDSESSPKKKTATTAKDKRLKTLAKVAKPAKKKQPANTSKAKGLTVLSEVALTEDEQMKLATKRSLIETHSSHASGSVADEGTGSKPGVPDVPTYGFDDEQISWKSNDEEDDDEVGLNDDDDDNDDDEDNDDDDDDDDDDADNQDDNDQEDDGQDDEDQDDVNDRRDSDTSGDDFTNVQTTQVIEDTHVIITPVNPKGQQQSSSVSSGFVSNMLNPSPDTGIDSIFNLNTESTSLIDVPVTTVAELPLLSTTTLPPLPTPVITHLQQTPVPTPATVPSSSIQDLPNFGSLFGFDHRLKTLENDFLEFKQTNQFAVAVSSVPGIVDTYLANKMNEAVKTVVQLQSDRLKDEAQAENEDFLNKLDDNIKKIIKDQVKEQTSHAVAANLSELKLKKILIDKIESNKSIYIADEQKNLYKALVDAYESDKLILDTYGDIVLFKKRRYDEDKDEEPSAGSNQGPKRRRTGKEPESTSEPKEKTSKTTSKSTEGSKSHHKSAGESAQTEEPRHTAKDLEEPAHLEFETGVTEDQLDEKTSQLPDWFQKPAKPPTPYHD
ncbi:putative reverse transcriptase domain-containing protein [Tanacetum coccineum]